LHQCGIEILHLRLFKLDRFLNDRFVMIFIGLLIWDIVEWHQRRKASKEFDARYAEYERNQKQN